MNQEQSIIKRVLISQHNIDEADSLIRDYFPFIKSETAKVIGRIPVEGKDDELSIALMAFHEAIESYDQDKGAFLNFAALVIKRRIIDFLRQENQVKFHVSWEDAVNDESGSDVKLSSDKDAVPDKAAMKWEIGQLIKELSRFGINLSEVASNCPKYEKVIESCMQVIKYLISEPELMSAMFETGKLPISQIVENTSVRKKTLEKHRKYLIALSVIYFKKYDCLTAYLSEVFNFKKGGK